MQYDNYQRKIDKVASVLRYIFKHIVKISIAAGIVMAATITVLATKGIIISEGACPETIVYGEQFSLEAKAFLSRVGYEFCVEGTDDWSAVVPTMPGKYNVRAVSHASFGVTKYGEVESFAIVPKDIIVYPSETKVYGEKSTPISELAYYDRFSECDFEVLDRNADTLEETVRADSSSIVILNANGDDVTKAYNITVQEGKVAVTKRPLTLSIGSKTAEYDGTALLCEEYDISEGSVVEGDRLNVVFDDYVLDVGTVSNAPIISLINNDGRDMSAFYELTVNLGELTVTPRPITIATKNKQFTYDGKEHSCSDKPGILKGMLVEGHDIVWSEQTFVVDAGEYVNECLVRVCDDRRHGKDVTHNYDITYDYGTLTVKRRPITITTESAEFVYDGDKHTWQAATADKAVNGHALKIDASTAPSITFVGSISNEIGYSMVDKYGRDVTDNYEITYEYGTLTVVPRPIIIRTDSYKAMYDGEEHSAGGVDVFLDMDRDGVPDEYDLLDPTEPVIPYIGLVSTVFPETSEETTEDPDIDISLDDVYYIGLAGTDTFLIKSHTVITNVGTKNNVIELDIVSDYGSSVLDNYDITYEYGTLEITPRPLTVKPADVYAVYDGNAHGGETVVVADWSLPLVPGHNIAIDSDMVSGSRVDVGIGTLVYEGECVVFTGSDGRDVSKNYDITFEPGFVEIYPRTVCVYTGSSEKMYDGTPLTDSRYSVVDPYVNNIYPWPWIEESLDDETEIINEQPDVEYPDWIEYYYLVEGHELILVTDGSITDVGTAENTVSTYAIYSGDDDVTHNYDLRFRHGTLRVTPREITVQTATNSWVYDDVVHNDTGYTVISDIDLVEGHSLYAWGVSSIVDVGTVENVLDFSVFDQYGYDVSYNYSITYEYGTLNVTPRPITVQTGSMSWLYEDLYFAYDYFTITEGEIVEYHSCWAVEVTSICDVGSKDNVITIGIFSGERDVTHNYDITYDYGTLSVSPRRITVTTGSKSKVYDGRTWSYGKYDISGDGLVDWHLSLVFDSTSVCEVTIVPNVLDIIIFNLDNGKDVTKNYEITYEYGTLEVYEPEPPEESTEITEDTEETEPSGGGDVTGEGDGTGEVTEDTEETEPSEESTEITEDTEETEPSEESSEITEDTEETEPSEESSEITEDTEETEPSEESSEITEDTEETEPSEESSEITEDTEETETSGGGEGTGEGPDDPEETETSGGGEGTGEGPDDPEETETSGGGGGTGEGTDDPEETETSGGGGGTGEGPGEEDTGGSGEGGSGGSGQLDLSGNISGGSLGNGGGGGEILPSYIIWSTKDGRIYLRVKSFGDYNGNGFNEAAEYPFLIDSQYSALYLSSLALQGRGDIADMIKIRCMNGQYALPYYADPFISDMIQTSDVIVPGTYADYYELNIFNLSNISNLTLSGQYADYEREYRKFVYENYLSIDYETLEYMQMLIAMHGFDRSSGTVINDVANYISNSAIYDMKYDRELDKSENVVVAFLETYKAGICQHYAASAVMLYRALGIPARYTIGYAADAKANEWSLVTGMDAHAWVEVYVDGIGWIMVEVTGSGNDFGDMKPEPEKPDTEIVISPLYQYKEYDGTPLYAVNEISVPFELRELLDRGYRYEVVVVGEQTDIGTGTSYIESFILYDEYGNDVTDQFNIRYESGSLVVAYRTVKILLYKLQKYYDGTPLAFTDEDYEFITELPDGMTLDIDFHISLIDVGYLTMSDINSNLSEYITYTLYMNGVPVNDGILLVVDVFEGMSEDYIPIRIDKLDLELTAGSTSKNYDGEALEYDKVYISKGALADGDQLIAHATGSITEQGQMLNIIFENEVRIINKYGEDVTANYNITLVEGVLTVY